MTFTRVFCSVTAAFLLCLAGGMQRCDASELKITEMAVTTKVVKGKPIDSVRRISSSSVKALYCFTRFAGSQDTDTTVTHLWYRNNEVVGQEELPVKGAHWRAYSTKTVQKGLSGEWRCEVKDDEGKVLKTVGFTMN